MEPSEPRDRRNRRTGSVRTPVEVSATIQQLLDRIPETRVAELLGIGHTTLMRAAAGRPLRRGSLELITKRLRADLAPLPAVRE